MRARSAATALVTIALVGLVPRTSPHAQDAAIVSAMQDELKRSMSDLRLKGEPNPYYIAYEVNDVVQATVEARLGALVQDQTRRVRLLQVDVRVGDYTFDSSRFVTPNRGAPAGGTVVIPVDDNYDSMRREIWLATDAAYKRAVTVFSRKRAAFQNRSVGELLPDFSKETPLETIEAGRVAGTAAGWADRVRQISTAFQSSTDLYTSDVLADETSGMRYYVNSEGFKVVAPLRSASLRVNADTQTAEGTALRDGFTVVERGLQDMPPVSELTTRARAVATRLTAERAARVGEEYTGPILIEGEASADLVAQTLVPLMLARRPADSDNNGRGGPGPQGQVTPFLTRIGLRVLPDAFTVSDTPSLKDYSGHPVAGGYQVDDEGIRPKDVTLVENGKLVTLLTSRVPQRKLLQSNGHGRSGTVQAGVFQMRSSQAIPAAALKSKFLEVLKDQDKEFGYIVRGIGAGAGGPGGAAPAILQIVRVTPSGAEVPVRGLRFAPIASTTFRNILEASSERTLYNYLTGSGDIVSVIAPSLLFEELEVQQTRDIAQKPPTVPSPLKN